MPAVISTNLEVPEMKTTRYIIASTAVALLVSGCGGSSSSSSSSAGGGPTYGAVPTAAVQINSLNATQVSKNAYGSVNTMNSASSTGSTGTKAAGTPISQARAKGLANFASNEILGLYGTKFPVVPVGAAGAGTPVTCAGGGTRTSALTTDKNGNGVFDVTDTVTVTYASCNDGAGTVETGAMAFTLNTLSATPAAAPTLINFSATITFNRLKTVTAAETTDVTGDMTLSFTQDSTNAAAPFITMAVSGNSFDSQSSVSGVEQMTNYNLSFTLNLNGTTGALTSMSMSIGMTTAMAGATPTSPAGVVTITTPTAFTIDAVTGALTAGSIRFTSAGTGANGSYVEIAPVIGSATQCNVTVNDPTANPVLSTQQMACATAL